MTWSASLIQFTFSVTPQVSPVFFVSRVKGRLDHALRKSGRPTKFSRKVAFRTIGDNRTTEVETHEQPGVCLRAESNLAVRLLRWDIW